MQKFTIGEEADAAAELTRLLELNGFIYSREEERYRLVFADRGRKWETVCVCREQAVVIYGIYPFPLRRGAEALTVINQLNSLFLTGGMFLSGETAVFRTCADLPDAYGAYEAIARALEYNAGVIYEFWPRLAACSEGNTGARPIRGETSSGVSDNKNSANS